MEIYPLQRVFYALLTGLLNRQTHVKLPTVRRGSQTFHMKSRKLSELTMRPIKVLGMCLLPPLSWVVSPLVYMWWDQTIL